MPTHYEYAVMSQQVYNTGGGVPPRGWRVLHSSYHDNEFGFAATVYCDDDKAEAVIAFRGTWVTWDIITDTFLACFKQLPITLHRAEHFVSEVTMGSRNQEPIIPRNYIISFTGHSLGAVLAELCACRSKVKAVTFDSPGCKHFVDADTRLQEYREENIICYLSAPNSINTLNPHIGKLFRIYIPHAEGLNLSHIAICLLASSLRLSFYSTSFLWFTYAILEGFCAELDEDGFYYDHTAKKCRDIGIPNIRYDMEIMAVLLITVLAIIYCFIASTLINSLQIIMNTLGLKKQHSMDNIIQIFDETTGEAKYKDEIISWPKFHQHQFLSTTKRYTHLFIPLSSTNRGIHTFFKENEVKEEQIKNMTGYKVLSQNQNNAGHVFTVK